MYRGLYFKIILILVIFILIVMSVVGAVLITAGVIVALKKPQASA